MSGYEADANPLSALVNRLTQELAEVRRALAAAQRKIGTTTRALEGRSQELNESRMALKLLLATLDATEDAVLARGSFSRTMHYNERFIELWRIPADKLPGLNEESLLAIQLSQVRNPARFLADVQARRAVPEEEQLSVFEMTDGRVIECEVRPHRVGGRRIGVVTRYRDVTGGPRLAADA
jgi:PAS domain-containing protein